MWSSPQESGTLVLSVAYPKEPRKLSPKPKSEQPVDDQMERGSDGADEEEEDVEEEEEEFEQVSC